MIITRIDPLTQKESQRNLDITSAQLDRYQNGALLQDAFPQLSKGDREFFLTGTSQESWDKMFGEDE